MSNPDRASAPAAFEDIPVAGAHATATTLDLLSPWALAASLPLTAEHRTPVRAALLALLEALDAPAEAGLARIDATLAGLPAEDCTPLALRETGTSSTPDEIEDYDRYFGLRHVESQAPSLCLVRGLIVMAREFFALAAGSNQLDPTAIAIQRDGLRQQAALLARVFDVKLAR